MLLQVLLLGALGILHDNASIACAVYREMGPDGCLYQSDCVLAVPIASKGEKQCCLSFNSVFCHVTGRYTPAPGTATVGTNDDLPLPRQKIPTDGRACSLPTWSKQCEVEHRI